MPNRIDELLSQVDISVDTITQYKKIYYGISKDRKSYFLMERGLEKNKLLSAGYYPYMSMTCKLGDGTSRRSAGVIQKIFESYLSTSKEKPYNQ